MRIIIVTVMVVVLLPGCIFALMRAREQARRSSCLSNVKQLGLALKQYSQDFAETYPWHVGVKKPGDAWLDLAILFPNYCSAWKTFLCPSARDEPFQPKSESGEKWDAPWEPLKPKDNTEVISYAYGIDGRDKPTVPWTENAKSTVRLLADKKAGIKITDETRRLFNHRDDGRNALYQDGHVKWTAGEKPLDPDPDDDKVGKPGADDYKAFWSDPPWYREGMKDEEEKEKAEKDSE